ncbi:hypothetical protein L1987_76977 [Smallanthus sonchifolius]|uniref:Uncharacterized protein n=1 Tax=Smallanthus sonchifolius TaxID=185202 RepID=A0ACB8Z7R5_9ASTR|nr:hypothetical protein L1987_76977 [Smallanthus sonchifolius]
MGGERRWEEVSGRRRRKEKAALGYDRVGRQGVQEDRRWDQSRKGGRSFAKVLVSNNGVQGHSVNSHGPEMKVVKVAEDSESSAGIGFWGESVQGAVGNPLEGEEVREAPEGEVKSRFYMGKSRSRAHGRSVGPSSGCTARPKKRNRLELDDPFDLDRFLGPVQVEPILSKEISDSIEGDSGLGIAGNFDLNTRASSEFGGSVEASATMELAVGRNSGGVDDPFDQEMEEDIGATVKLGVKVGAAVQEFRDLVRLSIQDEGNNVVVR